MPLLPRVGVLHVRLGSSLFVSPCLLDSATLLPRSWLSFPSRSWLGFVVPRPWPLADLQVRLSLVVPWLVLIRWLLRRVYVPSSQFWGLLVQNGPRCLPRLVLRNLARYAAHGSWHFVGMPPWPLRKRIVGARLSSFGGLPACFVKRPLPW